MRTIKQLRKKLNSFKKNERYTWEAMSNLTGLTRPWLEKFSAEKEDKSYSYINLLKLDKFLTKNDY